MSYAPSQLFDLKGLFNCLTLSNAAFGADSGRTATSRADGYARKPDGGRRPQAATPDRNRAAGFPNNNEKNRKRRKSGRTGAGQLLRV